MPRLIIVDPALVGVGGHFYEFDRNVLDAATKFGYEPILIASQRCRLTHCGQWPVYPWLRDGLWTQDQQLLFSRILGRGASAGIRLRDQVVKSGSNLSDGGVRVLCWEVADRAFSTVLYLRDVDRATRLTADLAKAIEQLGVTKDDHIFVPNMFSADTIAVADLIAASASARIPVWHLEFHVNPFPGGAKHDSERSAETRILRRALLKLKAHAVGCRVRLFTDTDQLTAQYLELDVGRFETLPIPVDPRFAERDLRSNQKSRAINSSIVAIQPPLKIAYIGGGRLEKGFLRLESIIESVWSSLVAPGKVRFVLQANCPNTWGQRATWSVRQRLMRLPQDKVEILPDALCSEDYLRLVQESDVILLPYLPSEYEARSSGIFAEAVCSGVPVIVTSKTWMASELTALQLSTSRDDEADGTQHAKIGLVCDSTVPAMMSALHEITSDYDSFRRDAARGALLWAARHNPAALVNTLISVADSLPRSSGNWAA